MTNEIIKRTNSRLQKISSSEEAIDCDRFTVVKMGIDENLLMENAGHVVADFIKTLIEKNRPAQPKIVIFAGPGNNGADALVLARHLLADDFDTMVFVDDKKNNDAVKKSLAMLSGIAQKKGDVVVVQPWTAAQATIKMADLTILVDGIFGAGLNRAPSGTALEIIRLINNIRAQNPRTCKVVSIDVPSGLSLEASAPVHECVKADHTVTFDMLKRVHISEPTKIFCGQTHSKTIGLFHDVDVKNFYCADQKALIELFLPVKKNCHKGEFGHVVVYEGHAEYKGAARICARAALRAGAGLLTIANSSGQIAPYDLPEFMQKKRGDITPDFLKKVDVLVVGPGLSKDEQLFFEAILFVNQLFLHVPVIVVDADGLPMLSDKRLTITGKHIIATPHAKEAGDLLGINAKEIEQDRFLAIEKLGALSCNKTNQIYWILKGGTTLVRSPAGEIFAFRGDLPILAAGGSGDMLSGLIAGLIKQTSNPLDAALLAVSLQIEAGKELSKKIFKGSLVTELCDVIPLLTKRRKII